MIIHCFWVGNQLSPMEQLSLRSHLKVGHEVNLWRYEPLDAPSGVIQRDAREIMPESEVFAYAVGEGKGSYSACSNVFRYLVLKEYGNWWSDLDVIALKPFDFEDPYVFASERTKTGYSMTTSCVIKAPPQSDFTRYCLNVVATKNKERLGWGIIGPQLVMTSVWANGLLKYVKNPEKFCPYDWFESEADPIGVGKQIPDCHAVHLWHEMWRRKAINTADKFDDNSLYERLRSAVLSS